MLIFRDRVRLTAASLGMLVAACGSGGGGGGDSQPSVSFVLDSSAVAEDGSALAVEVELRRAGGGLAAELTVDVEFGGSATLGADFTLPGGTTVTFAAGSLTGDRQVVSVVPTTDMLVEPPEDIALQLVNVSAGAVIGTRSLHAVELEEANPATVRFVASESATPDESAGDHGVEVELATTGGAQLAVDLTVEVADAGAGSATSGSDYADFPVTQVTFSAGSGDGVREAVQVGVLDDDEVEGDESVVLVLRNPSLEGTVIGQSVHDVIVTDDDATGPAFLSVKIGAAQTAAHSGDSLDLGSAVVGGAEQDGELMTVANLGNDMLDLDAPYLVGADSGEFKVTVEEGPLAGAMTAPVADFASPLVQSAALGKGLAEMVVDATAEAVLDRPAHAVWHDFELPDGATVDLDLERLRSPWSADAVIWIDGAPSDMSPAEMTAGLNVWRGSVVDVEDSNVFLATTSAGVDGWIRVGSGPENHFHLGTVHSATGTVWVASEARLLGDTGSPPNLCAGSLGPAGAPGPEANPGLGELVTSGGALLADCRIAIETDYQFFSKLESSQAVTNYVTSLIAAVSNVYLADVQTTLSIAYLGIHTTADDGWSTPDGPGSTIAMIDEFQAAWGPSFGGSWPVQANLAHFISGASMGGGVAYVDVLCNSDYGFGVSADMHGRLDWSTFDYGVSSLSWDFVVVAHELGHNFGALHTHDYCPPLDTCQPTCEGPRQCGSGTLMSYCHLCSGGFSNLELRFHPFVANEMRREVNASCLEPADLGPGEYLTYRLCLVPTSTGAKGATLHLGHTAANEPNPFALGLEGQGTD